jgi:hypothetical protein
MEGNAVHSSNTLDEHHHIWFSELGKSCKQPPWALRSWFDEGSFLVRWMHASFEQLAALKPV